MDQNSYKHDGYRSRKFVFSVCAYLLTTLLLVAGLIPATIWESTCVAIIMTFVGGNVMEKYVSNPSARINNAKPRKEPSALEEENEANRKINPDDI